MRLVLNQVETPKNFTLIELTLMHGDGDYYESTLIDLGITFEEVMSKAEEIETLFNQIQTIGDTVDNNMYAGLNSSYESMKEDLDENHAELYDKHWMGDRTVDGQFPCRLVKLSARCVHGNNVYNIEF